MILQEFLFIYLYFNYQMVT